MALSKFYRAQGEALNAGQVGSRRGRCNNPGGRRNRFGGRSALLARAEPARQIDAMESEKDRTATNFEHRQPEGDSRHRLVCRECGFIQYENPKIVVGSVAQWQDSILLCRRAINPRQGYWTLPAGYLELNETSLQGAEREAWEEAGARIEILRLIAVYNIPRL